MDDGILINTVKLCNNCLHRIKFTANCKAYPNGIPKEILEGKVDHNIPYENDNGITFEKNS
ncbi:hypothetical protein [Clostridium cellulovorans]|uniref:Uncharacterized protein n=1 Tax=Clostridium cellulovorans (strain ATCC 35296 / DSM 3052 / OCM 3 / 743B) TaxID=573061 RepID=D9SWE0_CLOC7|nr:hypothetical protein [Clostridium cellulovorans]ADL53222.1 hypothetical protein Clocel_3546 [Clostridium cellulovorans 743B]